MSVFTNRISAAKEEAQAYTGAVIGLLGEQDPMKVLPATEQSLRTAVAGLTDQQLRHREQADKWSIVHVLQHLVDSEIVWSWRLRLVLAHDRPTITGYDQDAWADRLGYDQTDAACALAEFAVLRKANLRLLNRATPADRKRIGVHSERGEESVEHMMKLYAGHDLLHLNQIARIRAAVS
jgi:uncharacterized damage-inducible protein DinB